jgi:hypothetical protein
MQREIVRTLLGRNLRGDVACGTTVAVKAPEIVYDRLARETQDALAVGAVLDPANDIAEGTPHVHGLVNADYALGAVAVVEKVAKWPHEEFLRRETHDFGETLREKDEPALAVGLPDPVCARLGDVAKARFAGFDGARRLPGMIQDEPGGPRNEPKCKQKRRQDVTDQLLPERWRLPRQAT